MYSSPNYGRKHNRRGNGARVYFLREDMTSVYSSADGAKFQVLATSLEQAIDKANRGDIVKAY